MLHRLRVVVGLALLAGQAASADPPAPAVPPVADLLARAREMHGKGLRGRAIEILGEAVAAEPDNAVVRLYRGRLLSETRRHGEAIEDFTRAVQAAPTSPDAWQARGEENFRLGRFADSVADFDQVIALRPAFAARHWQRGISCFYAGRFEEGRKQFELHRTVNPGDVENAIWHYLCLARLEGAARAREQLIPVRGDPRVPMAEIHALFGGNGEGKDVLAAAKADGSEAALFYAELYLALFEDAEGRLEEAARHITAASAVYEAHGGMGEVARIHADELAKRLRDRAGARSGAR